MPWVERYPHPHASSGACGKERKRGGGATEKGFGKRGAVRRRTKKKKKRKCAGDTETRRLNL